MSETDSEAGPLEKNLESEIDRLASTRGQDADLKETISGDEEIFSRQERQDKMLRAMAIHEWRKFSLIALFAYLCAWSLAILALVFLSGAKPAPFDLTFGLSDSVLITLLTTTLAQVIGLLTIAFKWLFPREGK